MRTIINEQPKRPNGYKGGNNAKYIPINKEIKQVKTVKLAKLIFNMMPTGY